MHLRSNKPVPPFILCAQVSQEYLELSKMAAMDLQEIRASPESRAEWVEPGTRGLLASVTRQPAREQQQPENPPTPKTIKGDFLRPDATPSLRREEERRGKRNRGSDTGAKNIVFI